MDYSRNDIWKVDLHLAPNWRENSSTRYAISRSAMCLYHGSTIRYTGEGPLRVIHVTAADAAHLFTSAVPPQPDAKPRRSCETPGADPRCWLSRINLAISPVAQHSIDVAFGIVKSVGVRSQ